jgi:hypothetical protein
MRCAFRFFSDSGPCVATMGVIINETELLFVEGLLELDRLTIMGEGARIDRIYLADPWWVATDESSWGSIKALYGEN